MFRFSLKWILAAMVYAAIAAAAFSQESWAYADVLCAASLLALGYAVVLIVYARGARQAAATGFAVFMILLASCMQLSPESIPTLRILTAAGGIPTPILPSPTIGFPATGSATFNSSGAIVTGSSSFTPSTATWALRPTPISLFPASPPFDISPKLRAANAIATMTIGLVGCLLGIVAFRRARRTDATL